MLMLVKAVSGCATALPLPLLTEYVSFTTSVFTVGPPGCSGAEPRMVIGIVAVVWRSECVGALLIWITAELMFVKSLPPVAAPMPFPG